MLALTVRRPLTLNYCVCPRWIPSFIAVLPLALEEERVVWSPRFGDLKRGFWRMKIYPYGDSSPGGKGHVSLFLTLDTKNTGTYAIFSCYVIDSQRNKGRGVSIIIVKTPGFTKICFSSISSGFWALFHAAEVCW